MQLTVSHSPQLWVWFLRCQPSKSPMCISGIPTASVWSHRADANYHSEGNVIIWTGGAPRLKGRDVSWWGLPIITEKEFPFYGHCYSPFPVTLDENGPWKNLALFCLRGFCYCSFLCPKTCFLAFRDLAPSHPLDQMSAAQKVLLHQLWWSPSLW